MPAPRVLTAPQQATASWLSGALRRAGTLPRGRVVALSEAGSRRTSIWTLHRLEVRYSPDAAFAGAESAPGQLGPPARLMLKLSNSAGESAHHGLGSGQEVWFSRHLAPAPEMARVPLVRCYAAAHAPPHGASHALVEDLSETHWQPPYPLPPPDALCGEAVDSLAALHGAWWGHARLAQGGDITRRLAWIRGAAGGAGLGQPLEGVARDFREFLGDRLASQRRRLVQRLLAALPCLRLRRLDGPRTLLHGDAHWWNYLYPNDPARETTRLLDWGSWRVGAPADDLAYALALQWYPERRRRLEEPLLRRYHDALLRAGVCGYGWDDLWADYRLSVATGLLTPARFWALGVPPYIWWPMLECACLAFEDLGCAALLGV